jgi:hypothetical protein
MRSRTEAVPLAFSDDDSDDSLQVSSDYFWMLQSRVIDENTRASWRSFRNGFATMSAFYRGDGAELPTVPPPPSMRGAA